ncbi:tetraspanin-8-like protein [Lates japonicus]|uniref:Tetraspanin n=1 Tax=Lates japonicus TaxID=270547 RepID=A0AAD3QXB3_LATJO|nr:tetraspanin-8-like protein [Lates japonicus]
MAQVNTCLKRVFTIFNILFAIVGGVIIGLTLLSQVITNINGEGNVEGRTSGLIILYVVGIVTMMIAILGAYGAHKESKVCLIIFLVCMVIGSLLTLRTGVPAAIMKPQLEGILEEKFRSYLPLDKAVYSTREMADTIQTQLHCCGMFSYTDWEDNIPDSCLCSPAEMEEDKCQTSYMLQGKSIYSKACFPIIMHYVLLIADIVIGITFTLAALALLGMILSSIMIYQIRYSNRPTILMSVPTIFTTAPPKYQELHNPPPY